MLLFVATTVATESPVSRWFDARVVVHGFSIRRAIRVQCAFGIAERGSAATT